MAVVFSVFAGINHLGSELWVTRGFRGDAQMLRDIAPGAEGSMPTGMTTLADGRIIFSAMSDTAWGMEPWITDGTAAGTIRLANIASDGWRSSSPHDFVALPSGGAVFAATVEMTGTELYVTNGTESGTRLLMDIRTGGLSSNPTGLTALGNGKVLFAADNGVHGIEPWVTNGTAEGTFKLADIVPFGGSSGPVEFFSLADGTALFAAEYDPWGKELYLTDGTKEGTRLLANISVRGGGNPHDFALLAPGIAVFAATHDTYGTELYKWDGQTVSLVKDLLPGDRANPANYSSEPFGMTSLGNGQVIYSAFGGVGQGPNGFGAIHQNIMVSDGTIDGTFGVGGPQNHPSLHVGAFTLIAPGRVLFDAYTDLNGREVYLYDAATKAVTLVADLVPGFRDGFPERSYVNDITAIGGGRAIFYEGNANGAGDLWVTDGTQAGTYNVSDFRFTSDYGSAPIATTFDMPLPIDTTSHSWVGTANDDRFIAGSGNDTLNGGAGNDYIWGGYGDDHITGGAGNDVIFAGGGNNTLYYTGPRSQYNIGDVHSGMVTITDMMPGRDGIDSVSSYTTLVFAPEPVPMPQPDYFGRVYRGDAGNNVVAGNAGWDTILGGAGNDTLYGMEGNDKLVGGAGDDRIEGNAGLNTAYYQGTRDQYTISYTNGQVAGVTDRVAGRDGSDTLSDVENLHFANPEIFRFYRPAEGSHFFTSSVEERDMVQRDLGFWFTYEGVAGHAADPGLAGTSALYRFYRPAEGTHFYTASAEERDMVIRDLGKWYTYDGPSYSVSTTAQEGFSAVHRFYNFHNGSHFYTQSEDEAQNVKATLSDWYNYDGIAYYQPTADGLDNMFA